MILILHIILYFLKWFDQTDAPQRSQSGADDRHG
jgi:hypothetical protein